MDTALLIAIFGAIVTALGWLVNAFVERRRQRLLSQLDYTKQQLEELYGPLAFLLLEGQQSATHFAAIFGGIDIRAQRSDLSEHELALWNFWVENDFFPRHEQIKTLISSKTHLIEGEKVPKSFLAFVEHHNSWLMDHKRWQQQEVNYPGYSKIAWPGEFDEEVLSTFGMLKKRHAILIGKISAGITPLHFFKKNQA